MGKSLLDLLVSTCVVGLLGGAAALAYFGHYWVALALSAAFCFIWLISTVASKAEDRARRHFANRLPAAVDAEIARRQQLAADAELDRHEEETARRDAVFNRRDEIEIAHSDRIDQLYRDPLDEQTEIAHSQDFDEYRHSRRPSSR